jgi:hypothetical protein
MKFSSEALMAYADDELAGDQLDAATRSAIAAAIANDPQLAGQVQAFREQHAQMRAAFDGVLSEPMPDRLRNAVQATRPGQASLGNLDAARAAKRERAKHWGWPQFGAIAASLIVGIILGHRGLQPTSPLRVNSAGLTAQGSLDEALTSQLAATQQPADAVQIGLSFQARSGEYCRTFALPAQDHLAGLACRQIDGWHVSALSNGEPGQENSETYRMAGSAMPDSLRRIIEAQISGEPLDADAERAAREQNWKH